MNNVIIKSCPFCGGEATLREGEPHTIKKDPRILVAYGLGCSSCGIEFMDNSELFVEDGQPHLKRDGYTNVVEKWNRRATNE